MRSVTILTALFGATVFSRLVGPTRALGAPSSEAKNGGQDDSLGNEEKNLALLPSGTMEDQDECHWKIFGERAYMYGCGPLWAYKKHHDQTHNTIDESVYAPVNKLFISSELDTVDHQLFVSPNPNTLYASAHLNLTHTSVRLLVKPNPNDQFYVWQIMDAFTNSKWYIASTNNPNTTMANEGNFTFKYTNCTGAGCDDYPRENMTVIEVDNPNIWIVTRYYVENNTEDNVNATRKTLLESTLGVTEGYNASKGNPENYTRPGTPEDGMDVDNNTVRALDYLNEWISLNGYGPMHDSTESFLTNYGLYPNSTTVYTDETKEIQANIKNGAIKAQNLTTIGTGVITINCNGWRHLDPEDIGVYGEHYYKRSIVAKVGLGANIPTIGMYYVSVMANKLPMDVYARYMLTLPKIWVEHPPYNKTGFWSLTAYNHSNGRLLNTTAKIKNVHYPSDTIVQNENNETVIQISPQQPDDLSTMNWLPLPEVATGYIYLILRIYGAKEEVVHQTCDDTKYNVPRVIKVCVTENGTCGGVHGSCCSALECTNTGNGHKMCTPVASSLPVPSM